MDYFLSFTHSFSHSPTNPGLSSPDLTVVYVCHIFVDKHLLDQKPGVFIRVMVFSRYLLIYIPMRSLFIAVCYDIRFRSPYKPKSMALSLAAVGCSV